MKKDIDKSSVALYLEPSARKKVFYACALFMFFIASSQAGLTILQRPMLKSMNMLEQFPIVTIMVTIGMAIMTPIGGKIGDLIGRRNLILIAGTIVLASITSIALLEKFTLYLILRLTTSLGQGMIISVPYIIVGQIIPRNQAPKYMGMLSSSMALGTFIGAVAAGFLADANLTVVAILYPLLFLTAGMLLVAKNLPNILPDKKTKFDILGVVFLAITLVSLVLSLNYGNKIGWTNPKIIGGFVTFIVALLVFTKVEKNLENKGGSPIIAISLFKNKEYSVLLLVGFTAYFYLNSMTSYGSYAAINILGTSTGVAGTLTTPRTLVTLVLPIFTGVWVGKKVTNRWKAMALGTGLIAVALIPLAKITDTTSITMLYIAFAITGIAESFRSVSITPSAQSLLEPQNLATGTALLNFVNTLAPVFSSAVGGALFSYSNGNDVMGIRLVFSSAIIVAVIGFLLTIIYIRPMQARKVRQEIQIKKEA